MQPILSPSSALPDPNRESSEYRSNDVDDDGNRDPDTDTTPLESSFADLSRPATHTESSDTDETDDLGAMNGDFSMSFDEDILIPSKTSWHGSSAERYQSQFSITRGEDLDDSSTSIYSKAPSSDSKITVSRAVYVSQQPPKGRDAQGKQRQNNSASAPGQDTGGASGRALSRTWSNLRKTTKLSWPDTSSAAASSGSQDVTPPGPHTPGLIPAKKPGELNDSSKKAFVLRRKSTKSSLGSMLGFTGSDSPPPAPSPKRRPATPLVTLPLAASSRPSTSRGNDPVLSEPPRPVIARSDRYRKPGTRIHKKKDDLWSAFRSLDTDYQKFQTKPGPLKTNIVRTTLLPFLQSYADHPSNKQLRPEDLDRRATILNKWWSAILEMLKARNGQSVSGTDRPVLLDAVSAIMDRPEWRCSFSDPGAAETDARPTSEETESSSDSGFFVESVIHNVRNLFVKNLFNQVVMAVDRMSLRHAPASLVSFSAKTCAYAFFYCQGIADVLVRLWDIPTNVVKRVVKSSNVDQEPQLGELSDAVCSAFPRPVHDLAFRSYRRTVASLKQKPLMPLGVEKVQWHGHWSSRWTGKDSDLFFGFAKHYYSLLSDFLPNDATEAERMCAPGYVLVQAQMLVNLDSTINRASKTAPTEPAIDTALTFDDLMSPASEPLPTGLQGAALNASRLMAENRMIMLMRGVFASEDAARAHTSTLFAESMCGVMKASVQSTSIYNHNACFTLCDFLQEAFIMLLKFETSSNSKRTIVDWSFWLDMFRNMLKSENTMTEIRLYAFLYSSWSILTADDQRKSSLCLNLLLSEEHFGKTFYHWCPMVRAYYMRLVCWRIARFDGDASEIEIAILKTLMARLQSAWRHFKFLVGRAHADQKALPSTAPCNPAPGRRLLIIRTDTPLGHISQGANASAALQGPKNQLINKSSNSADEGTGPTLFERFTSSFEQSGDPTKRKGGMLRSLLTYRGTSPQPRSKSPPRDRVGASSKQSDDASPASSPPGSRDNSRNPSPERIDSRGSMYEERPVRPLIERAGVSSDSTSTYTQAFFKFSLEFVDRGPHSAPSEMRLVAPRVPLAAQLLLQSQTDFSSDFEARASDVAPISWIYVGRALAEWTLVVNECQNFFIRRRNEGVPTNKLVETPTLGVESFRRPG